jgi:nicotinate-nucleotide--dimethylbenzimidazole phosphoribosyltransferase
MKFKVEKVSNQLKEKIKKKINEKTKPLGALGKLEDIASQIALIQNTLSPELKNPTIIVFASDHGISSSGVSAYPQEVTYQMVLNFLNGGAAINVFCRQNYINIKVVDAGANFDFPENAALINAKIGHGTKNFLIEPAMTLRDCKSAILKGAEIVESIYKEGCNTIGFGDMGIGNTSSASVIISLLSKLPIEKCVGPGTGLNKEGVKKKIKILKRAIQNHPEVTDDPPLSVLSTFGGFEIAMICGAILKAAELKMVIIIDGFIITSAYLTAFRINKHVKDYCIFSHLSNEKGHKIIFKELDIEPLLNLNMRLGEGTGAAVSFPIIKSAVNFLNEMASFESAAVSNKNE